MGVDHALEGKIGTTQFLAISAVGRVRLGTPADDLLHSRDAHIVQYQLDNVVCFLTFRAFA